MQTQTKEYEGKYKKVKDHNGVTGNAERHSSCSRNWMRFLEIVQHQSVLSWFTSAQPLSVKSQDSEKRQN